MKKIFAMLLFAAVLCGCHSDQYYHNEAVERARNFLLANSSDLSSEQIYFVRFNSPVLLHAPVLDAAASSATRLSAAKHQICVTWMIPGKEELCMVFGVSGGRMSDWQPNRIIYKKVITASTVLPQVADKCVKYAGNYLRRELSDAEYNSVRYTMPWLLATAFEVNFNPEGSLPEKDVAALKRDAGGKKQYSVVWKFGGRNLVFTGLALPGFKKWDIMMASVVSDAELAGHTVMELMTPDDYSKPFPVEKENLPAAK